MSGRSHRNILRFTASGIVDWVPAFSWCHAIRLHGNWPVPANPRIVVEIVVKGGVKPDHWGGVKVDQLSMEKI
jgi:hypothetical protein